MKPTFLVLAGVLLAAPSYAQLKPGTFLATVQGSSPGIFVVDRFANTATRMTINNINNWSGVVPVRTFIEDANNFLLLTSAGYAHVLRVTWTNGTWQATFLTTTAPPVWGWDIARIGGTIYFVRSAGGSTATDGQIWQLPATGGAPTLYANLGPTVVGMPMAMEVVGNLLHVFMWDAANPTQGGEHISVDTTVNPPVITRRGRLPLSKAYTCGTLPVLPAQACLDPATGLIVVGGRTGDVIWRANTGNTSVTVRHHVVNTGCLNQQTQWGNALAINTDTGAVLFGDADRSMEELTSVTGPWVLNIQTLPGLATKTAIWGLEYFASGSFYRPVGNGCAQTNGQIACNYVTSLPIRGTPSGVTVLTPAAGGFLIIGVTNPGLSLAPYGAPGCLLGPTMNALIPVAGTGTGFTVKFPVPTNLPAGTQAYTQWAIRDIVNPFGYVTSDTRLIKP